MKKENDFAEHDYIAFLHGAYIREAIVSTVGNMFKKKTSKTLKYPNEPYSVKAKREPRIHENMSEEDKRKETEKLFKMLERMEQSFNRNNSG